MINKEYDFQAKLDLFTIDREYNYAMLNSVVPGNLDMQHVMNLIHRLFLIQLYATDSDLVKVIVTIDCSNNVLAQVKLYDDFEVSVIDASALLSNEVERNVELLISNELKNNQKIFKKYNK